MWEFSRRAETSRHKSVRYYKLGQKKKKREGREGRKKETKRLKKKRVTQVSVEINRSLRKKEIKKEIGKRWREREKRIECFFGIVSQLMPINVNEVELCAVR